MEVYLHYNQIKFIGFELFNGLAKLNIVFLISNDCVDKNYEGSTELIQLKDDIDINCKRPWVDTWVIINHKKGSTELKNGIQIQNQALNEFEPKKI